MSSGIRRHIQAYGMGWDGMVWDGMVWDGMGWDGMGWDGMGWDGMGWDGMVWDGMGWDGTAPLQISFVAVNLLSTDIIPASLSTNFEL